MGATLTANRGKIKPAEARFSASASGRHVVGLEGIRGDVKVVLGAIT